MFSPPLELKDTAHCLFTDFIGFTPKSRYIKWITSAGAKIAFQRVGLPILSYFVRIIVKKK